MTTAIEYALMAGASYRDTRPDINKFPIPAGWSMVSRNPQDNVTGFEAATFGNSATLATSTNIVISFAGTDPSDITGDIAADLALASGILSAQLKQAADYYLQVKAANPGATISFTGHSLGGGLASLMAVMFGESAYTFDQAPFLNSAKTYSEISPLTGIPTTHSVALELKDYLSGQGFAADNLTKLDAFIAASNPFNVSPNPADTLVGRSAQVTNINTDGEFLTSWFLVPSSNRIGSQLNIANSNDGVSGIDLHSQALLTAFLQSNQTATVSPSGQVQSLSEVTFNPDNPLGRETMARQVARQVCHLREVHRSSMDAEQAAKMAANRPPALA